MSDKKSNFLRTIANKKDSASFISPSKELVDKFVSSNSEKKKSIFAKKKK